jgi:hypothetical protein
VHDLLPGAQFAGCRIDAVAGRGGMGIVYRATELSLGRPVALKLIASERAADAGFRARFQRESRLAAAIDHPNVIPIYQAGEQDGRLYLVMRYVPGTDLHALLAREGRLAPGRAAAIVAQVAAALDAAHAAGLVHRDVKPANVLLTGEPGLEHAYLSDFGLTRTATSDTRLTDTGEWVGSVDFMAPERLQGRRTDARADVYALGCVLHHALTGAVPFPRETVPATILAHLHEPPPRPSATPGVPAAFDPVAARAMAKLPAERYPSAGDLGRAALAAVAGEAPALAERSVARGPAAPEAADGNGAGADPAAPTRALGGRSRTLPWRPARRRPAVPPAETEPGPYRRHRGVRRGVLVGAAGLLAAGVAAAALAAGGRLGGAPAPSGPLTAAEVRSVAGDFAGAYGGEDARALSRTLARQVTRVTPGDRERGRAAVLAVYRRQFAANAVRSYRLAGLDARGGAVGRASGHYTVTRAGRPPIRGRIVFGVVREDGGPRIALIAATPGS